MLTDAEKNTLLVLARKSLEEKLIHHKKIPINKSDYSEALLQPASSFVTLKKNNQLRGCIGNLRASRPLIENIIENTIASALHDRRFPRVEQTELASITISLSILSETSAIAFSSEEDLLAQLVPHQDGLILKDKGKTATFLPAVWESLPHPKDFLNALKLKAGLPEDHWSSHIQIERYLTESFSEKFTIIFQR